MTVHIRNLSRRFADHTVLDQLDLDLPPGSFTALLGRSGSGKTTLLRTLAGLDPAPIDATIDTPTPHRRRLPGTPPPPLGPRLAERRSRPRHARRPPPRRSRPPRGRPRPP